MKYIIANWKSNKDLAEVTAWIKHVQDSGVSLSNEKLELVLCPSFIHLSLVKQLAPGLSLGAQTVSAYPYGAYTGAIAAAALKEFAEFVILGHAERRKYFHEGDTEILAQVTQALDAGITPILAVDAKNWATLLSQLSDEQRQKVLVMYEPAEAISSSVGGHAADLDEVIHAVQLIKVEYRLKGVLYGGSVNSKNIRTYLQESLIDGVVPGAASLDADELLKMVSLAEAM